NLNPSCPLLVDRHPRPCVAAVLRTAGGRPTYGRLPLRQAPLPLGGSSCGRSARRRLPCGRASPLRALPMLADGASMGVDPLRAGYPGRM
ncbi:hypothetical protein BHE74_00049326, partial [Ensete ventricosum]